MTQLYWFYQNKALQKMNTSSYCNILLKEKSKGGKPFNRTTTINVNVNSGDSVLFVYNCHC